MNDYIIVGAGTAGCVLANRLSEDPGSRVLLLEAGVSNTSLEVRMPVAFSKLFKSPHDWDFSTEPQPELNNRSLYWPRGKMLGGSSSMNAMMHVRGSTHDFDEWAARGNAGWNYRGVLPYFKRSENCERGASDHRGVGGPLHVSELRYCNPTTYAFIEAAEEIGLRRCTDVNAEVQEGVDFTQVTQRGGVRCSAAVAYLDPVKRRKNLRIVTGALTTRIIIEKERAVGVEYVVDGKTEVARAEREVIVAAGAVNSPQLLMLSGVGPADHLRSHGIAVEHDSPGVGQNLLDHLAVGRSVNAKLPVTLVAAESIVELLKFMVFKRGMLVSNVAEACGFLRTSEREAAPDLEIIYAAVPFIEHGFVKPEAHGLSIGVVLLQPQSAGSIALQSADPFAKPRINPRYLTDPDGTDWRVLLHGMEVARSILSAKALEKYVGDPVLPGPEVKTDEDVRAFIRQRAETLYHPVGTCKMGIDAEAVVAADLRVHGVEGLRVADASVMPTIVRGHPNAAVIMIAEKAADLIKKTEVGA